MRGAQLSPDAHTVTFTSPVNGIFQVFVMLTSGGEPLQLTSDEGDKLITDFSADGREIFYTRTLGRPEIWSVPTLGGNPRRVVPANTLAPSLDGKWLYFIGEDNATVMRSDPSGVGAQEIIKFDPAAIAPRQILPFPGDDKLLLVTFGPDGKMILKEVSIREHSSSDAASFSDDAGLPQWAEPGKSVLVPRLVNGIQNIWRFTLADRSLAQVTFGPGPDSNPMPDPSGRGLYYVNGRSSGFLTAYNTRTKESSDIVALRATQPTISPDKKRVEFVTSVGGQSDELWVADLDGKNKVKIAAAATLGTGGWSNDSSQFLYGDYSEPKLKIYIASADGGGVRPVPWNGQYAGSMIFSADQKSVYVSTVIPGAQPPDTWKLGIDGSDAHIVTKSCGYVSDTTSDGKYLAAFGSSGAETGLYEISTSDYKCTKLSPDVVTFGALFAADQKSMLYAMSARDSMTIYRQPWHDGKITGPAQVAFTVPFGFSIYANGNAYDFARDISTIVYARPGGQQDLFLLSAK